MVNKPAAFSGWERGSLIEAPSSRFVGKREKRNSIARGICGFMGKICTFAMAVLTKLENAP